MPTGAHRYWPVLAFVLAAACAVVGGGATAAMLDQYFPEGVPGFDNAAGVTVRSRLHPEQQPLGTRMGSFLVRPRMTTGLGYDSNVGGGRAGQGSWVLHNQPSIQFGSDWSRDALGGFLSADDARYLDQPAQSRIDGTLSVGGAVDIGRDRLSLGFAHVAQHEDRNRIDALPTDRPIAFTLDNARVNYAATIGRWTLTPAAEVSRWRYEATTIKNLPASQVYRNRDVLQGSATTRYEMAPLRNLLLVTRVIGQNYPDTLPGQPSQNSTGYQVLGGLDYDEGLWRYRFLVGGEVRQFASFPTRSAMIAESEVAWKLSGLTTVRGALGRSIEDAAQPGVSGFTFTTGRLAIDHEYARDLVLTASVGVQHAEYLQGGSQSGASARLGATWFVNRNVSVSASYDRWSYGGGSGGGLTSIQPSTRDLALVLLHLGL